MWKIKTRLSRRFAGRGMLCTEEEILEIAKSLNLDIEKLKKDANSEEVKQRILSDIDEATSRGIAGTPSTVIGSNVYVGIRQYDEFKRMFMEAGAEKR